MQNYLSGYDHFMTAIYRCISLQTIMGHLLKNAVVNTGSRLRKLAVCKHWIAMHTYGIIEPHPVTRFQAPRVAARHCKPMRTAGESNKRQRDDFKICCSSAAARR